MEAIVDPPELTSCPGCGFATAPRAKFCSECGLALRAFAASATLARPDVALSAGVALPQGPPLASPAAVRRIRGISSINRAERRQLTVMFCDLVGSTELSSRLDPEELSELLGRYRALVQGEVENLGGTTARFLGDGVMVFFGYPFAREDDAVRAVRAALGIVRGMDKVVERPGMYPPQGLRVHLGIHTGMVLLGHDPAGGVGDIIGETPNLASKVQNLAPPDTILVSSATHALTADLFEYAHWGPLELKGFDPSLDLFRLVGERDWRREDSVSRGRAKQFFGRAQETTRLARLWRDAQGGTGRVATIIGEPGIGKTRLTQWTAEHAEASGSGLVSFYCAEESIDTAFWPVAQTILSLCRLEGHTRATQLHRLRRVAAQAGLSPTQFVPALADLLWVGVDPPDIDQGGKLTAEQRRHRLVDLLLAWVAALAAEAPLLMVVENVNWADPSSRALLGELARRASGMRLLLLITARPEPQPPFADIAGVERFMLDRLPSHDLEAMLGALWRDAILPSEMQRQLLDRCDGVPLFLEQLVKTVAERAHRGNTPAGLPDVPTSLRDMLAARLDRLGPAKMIALGASVIGRQFSARLLRALLPRRASEIESGLALLVQADIIRPVGGPTGKQGEPSYKFRHALLRDAAYDSLLRSDRAKYHHTLAQAYRRHYSQLVEAQPELVARHISASGAHGEALEYWWKAGLRARARSANSESMAHFRAAIADAERLEDPEQGREQVIRFTMAAARAALSAEGFASPEVERLNNRALALVEAGGTTDALPAALGAVFSYYQVRGPLHRARASAERLMELTSSNDPAVLARNKRRLGWVGFCSGDIRGGAALLAEVIDYAEHLPPNDGGLAEGDAMVIGMANLGWAESFAGDLDTAAARCAAALALARRRYAEMDRHTHDVGSLPGDLAYAMCLSAAVAKQAQDPSQVVAFGGEARDFAITHDLPYWRTWATVLLGWGLAHTDAEKGTALLVAGIEDYKATGARLFVPYNLALLAEAHMAYGRVSEGLLCVEEALAANESIDARFVDSELLRIKARLMAQTGDTEGALATLAQAIRLASEHGAQTIREWAERDRRYLIDGTRGPANLLLATSRTGPAVAKTGTATPVAASAGTVKTGTVEAGAAQVGRAKTGKSKNGKSKTGESKTGTAKSAPSPTDAVQTGG